MSAQRCLVFFGIRFTIAPAEVEAVERRVDARMKQAGRGGLQCYWTDFGSEGQRYCLFVGRQVGVFGVEDLDELALSKDELDQMAAETRRKLIEAGFEGEPRLHIEWELDM